MLAKIYEPVCNVIPDGYVPPSGYSMVLNSKLLEFLQKAAKLHSFNKYRPEFEFVTLKFQGGALSGEMWVSSEYVSLPFSTECRTDSSFECAVRFADLIALLKVDKKSRAYRLDLKYDTVKMILTIDGGNWKSRLNCAAIPENEPKPLAREFSKAEQTELTWLKKAVHKDDTRPALMYAHVVEIDGIKRAYTADGYRVHLSIAAQGFEPGVIDIQKCGAYDGSPFQPFEIFQRHTEDKVWMNRADLESAVKKAKASVEKTVDGSYPIEFHFHTHYCAIIGRSDFKGVGSSVLSTSGMNRTRSFVMNAQYILDALQGSKAEKIMLSFSNEVNSVQFAVSDTRLAIIMGMDSKR